MARDYQRVADRWKRQDLWRYLQQDLCVGQGRDWPHLKQALAVTGYLAPGIAPLLREAFTDVAGVRTGWLDLAEHVLGLLEAHSEAVYGHSVRVAAWTAALAAERPEEVIDVWIAGLLHDAGKLMVSREILEGTKSVLTDEEWSQIRQHPVDSAWLAEQFGDVVGGRRRLVEEVTRGHHESPDGNGYPQKLKAEQTHWAAQAMKVVDYFDAGTAPRSYSASQAVDFTLLDMMGRLSSVLYLPWLRVFVGSPLLECALEAPVKAAGTPEYPFVGHLVLEDSARLETLRSQVAGLANG